MCVREAFILARTVGELWQGSRLRRAMERTRSDGAAAAWLGLGLGLGLGSGLGLGFGLGFGFGFGFGLGLEGRWPPAREEEAVARSEVDAGVELLHNVRDVLDQLTLHRGVPKRGVCVP